MSDAALRSLNKNFAAGRFDPAYYFHGDDDFRKEATLRRLIDTALEPGTRDFNLDQQRAAGLDAAALGTVLGTPPVFAPRRVVVLRDVSGLKKGPRGALERYLDRPASDVVVVLLSGAGDKVDGGLLASCTGVEFAALDESEAVEWAIAHAREAHNVELAQDAARLLCATAGSDLTVLAGEIDKCASYTGGSIDRAAVEAVVGVRHGETLGSLTEAVVQRRAADALRLVEPVLAQPKNGLVPILAALGVQLLGIGAGVALRRGGAPESVVRNRMWEVIRSSGPYAGGPWREVVDRLTRAAMAWQPDDIRRGLDVLLAADRSAKDSRSASDEQLLSSVVLQLCGTRRSVAA
jgi:DNA polymerase III subunit delta